MPTVVHKIKNMAITFSSIHIVSCNGSNIFSDFTAKYGYHPENTEIIEDLRNQYDKNYLNASSKN